MTGSTTSLTRIKLLKTVKGFEIENLELFVIGKHLFNGSSSRTTKELLSVLNYVTILGGMLVVTSQVQDQQFNPELVEYVWSLACYPNVPCGFPMACSVTFAELNGP